MTNDTPRTLAEISRAAHAVRLKLSALIEGYLDDGVDPDALTAAIDTVGELEMIERGHMMNGGEEHDA
jgi:hypothetical protein